MQQGCCVVRHILLSCVISGIVCFLFLVVGNFAGFSTDRVSTPCHCWMVSWMSGWTVDLAPPRSEQHNDMTMQLSTALAFGNLAYSNELFSVALCRALILQLTMSVWHINNSREGYWSGAVDLAVFWYELYVPVTVHFLLERNRAGFFYYYSLMVCIITWQEFVKLTYCLLVSCYMRPGYKWVAAGWMWKQRGG